MQNGWAKDNIQTFEDLDNYFSKKEKLNGLKKEISNKLRITRPLNSFEEEYILKWSENYGYKMDIIEIALKRSVLKSNAGFEYYDKLLTDWHDKGLTTPDEIEKHLLSITEKKTRVKQVQTMSRQYEYTQSTFDNFDNLYEN